MSREPSSFLAALVYLALAVVLSWAVVALLVYVVVLVVAQWL